MPAPDVPTVSMKASAPPIGLCTPFDAGSARLVAVSRTAGVLALICSVPLLGDGATETPDVTGTVVSTTRLTVTGADQLPAASRLRIETTRVPSGRPLTTLDRMVASRLTTDAPPAGLTVM